jgi:hypothetical protein
MSAGTVKRRLARAAIFGCLGRRLGGATRWMPRVLCAVEGAGSKVPALSSPSMSDRHSSPMLGGGKCTLIHCSSACRSET